MTQRLDNATHPARTDDRTAIRRARIGALAIKKGNVGRLVIGELEVQRLHVHELIVDRQPA